MPAPPLPVRHPRLAGGVLAVERRAPLVLLAMMAVTAAAWYWRGRGIPAPWIYGDEFIYWELGRSLAERGDLLIREQRLYYSLVTPLTAVPGHLLGDAQFAYEWIKIVNPILMATAAIPAYGLARMALRPLWALLLASATLAMPGFAYTGNVMTEAAFLPAFLLAVWALARALERPTRLRQGLAVAAVLLTIAVRLQGIAMFAAMGLAAAFVILRGTGAGSGLAGLAGRARSMAIMLGFAVGVPVLALIRQRGRGDAGGDLLGGYNTANTDLAGSEAIWEWGLRHAGVTILALALVPVAFAIGAWARLVWRRFGGDSADAALLACLAAVPPMLAIVVVFAANNSDRVQERNLFYIEPLLLLAGMIGLARGYSRVAAIASAAAAAWLMLRLPLDELLLAPPLANTFSLYAIWDAAPDLDASPAALVAGLAIAGLVLTIAATRAPGWVSLAAMPVVVAAFMIGMSAQVSPAINGYAERLAVSTLPEQRDWVERADTGGAPVGFLWPEGTPAETAWLAEIFNPKIVSVTGLPNPLPGLPVQAQVDLESGRLMPAGTTTELPPERFLVAPSQVSLAGRTVAEASLLSGGLRLVEVSRPLRVAFSTAGYYPDGWSAADAFARQFDCAGGTFTVTVGHGFGGPQRVELATTGGASRRITLEAGESRELRLPTVADPANGACTFTLRSLETATDDELSGSGNPRVLGARTAPPTFTAG